MRELALDVPAAAVEEVLDALLLIAPHGVIEVPRGDHVELRVRGQEPELPSHDAVAAAGAPWDAPLRERDVPDDPYERRLADYEPIVVAERLCVRPAWAPQAAPGLLEVVLADDAAFGTRTHPTTCMCLEALCELEPGGALLDLGCGSGVLSIAAALLGWRPVVAIDRSPEALAATETNAQRSGAVVDARAGDVATLASTPAAVMVANVPLPAHAAIAAGLATAPPLLIVSGVQEDDAGGCAEIYAAAGLAEAGRRFANGWALLTLTPRP